ncbi:MAG TPA: EAL domain-containing protein, partial [Rhodocyclaceae bacterium]|nr:EAL domain-containing protein [Rhodocyclaceae bacterium]
MDDVDVVAGKLATFRDMGIRIAVDDFGTGYSSLSYLKHLPIDRLKIDRSFISDIPGDPNDTAIAVAIIRLAQALNLEVIAEGVESAEQAALLMQEGCTLAQGFHYSRPLPGSEFVRYAQTANDATKAARASSTAAD